MAANFPYLYQISGSGLSIVSNAQIGAYSSLGRLLLRPSIRLSNLNPSAATLTVAIRNVTDGFTIWRTSEAKHQSSDTAMAVVMPSFYTLSGKTYAIWVQSTNPSDTNVSFTVTWYDYMMVDTLYFDGNYVSVNPISSLLEVDTVYLSGSYDAAANLKDACTPGAGFNLGDGLIQVSSVSGNVGGISGVSFPSNFGALQINSSGHISRVTLVDTTTANADMITPSGIRSAVGLSASNLDTQLAAISSKTTNLPPDPASQSLVSSVDSKVTTLLSRITSSLFQGITSLASWLGAIAGKSADPATKAEINATAGGASYDNQTDSNEAIRDKLDAAPTSYAIRNITITEKDHT
ncbi:MAG: hypothetical protein KatS3mg104_3062 [Phycisphaerae bacterium]|nr:MAG: hypothetical protein KatS3mg104_3062 [Phycisphaerae bacterium]